MSVPYYGDFAEDDTVNIPFNTFSSDDPSASVTITDLADADIKVHKDGSTDEIATDGATVVIDFDSRTGAHLITIDTSAHADYTTGSEYAVLIEGTTVDGGTITAWVGAFSIERAGGTLALAKLIQAAVITNAAGADIAADIIALKAETVEILADTDEIGAAGVGLTEAGGDGDHLTEAGGDGDHLNEAGGDGDHLTAIDLPNQTMDITGDLSGSVGSVTGAVGSVTAEVDADVVKISGDGTAADTLELFVEILNQSTGQLDNGSLDATMDVYQSKTVLIDDDTGSKDWYITVWFENGEPITSGITSPTIQVVKISDGSDLIASDDQTEIASLGLYKYEEGTDRVVNGAGYIAKTQATIGGATRTWFQPVGRDS